LRLDKSFDNVLDFKGLDSLIDNYNRSTNRMNYNKELDNKKDEVEKTKRVAKKNALFLDQYDFNNKIKCEQLNNALKNIRFCVMLNDITKKNKISEMIKEMSGKVIANPVKNQLD